jgi:hypothetical protein
MQMRRFIVRTSSRLLVVALVLRVGRAWACADGPAVETAEAQYARGMERAEQGDYQGALQAFTDANTACPHFAVLYNIAQAQIALDMPLEAVATLERYLREGQHRIHQERASQVEIQIAMLEALLGKLTVITEPTGALVSIDGHEVGRTPFSEHIRLAAGEHKVTASLDGREPVERSVAIGREERLLLDLQFPPPPKVNPIGGISLPPPPKPIPYHSGLRRALPYVLVGTGVALGGVALGVYLGNRDTYEQWKQQSAAYQRNTDGRPQSVRKSDAENNNGLAASLDRSNRIIFGGTIAAGVLVAAGASLYLFDRLSLRNSGGLAVTSDGRSSLAIRWRTSW